LTTKNKEIKIINTEVVKKRFVTKKSKYGQRSHILKLVVCFVSKLIGLDYNVIQK